MRTKIWTLAALGVAIGCGETRDGGENLPMGASIGGVSAGGDDDAESSDGAADDAADDDTDGGAAPDDGDEPGTKWDVGFGTGGEDPNPSCDNGGVDDFDGDGWSVAAGDCNDCDANVNPGAVEVVQTEPDDRGVVPEPADENCDGLVDNVAPPCDGGIPFDDGDAYNAAAAIGLCRIAADDDDWGLVDAQWVRANGTPTTFTTGQHGILDSFGPNVAPQEGSQHLVLSTGRARTAGMTGACNTESCDGLGAGTAPPGFPQDVPACAGATDINDDVALEVTLRAPSNATGYRYNFDFYSFEYPEWVCTSYNDQYVAIVDPAPEGAINGNISFDSASNPVSVNIAFFEVCSGCTLGTAELQGTGFDTWDDAGATSWLQTTAPVEPGSEITIRFAIFDTGDTAYDSTVLIDNFQWIATHGTPSVGTVPEG